MLELIALASVGFLLMVWFGYPLLVGALARRSRPSAGAYASAQPTVSVIIATRDEVDAVRARVANCFSSTYDRDKLDVVIGVDARRGGAAVDEIRALCCGADAFERCSAVLGDAPGGKAATLNAAVRASRGDVLVFTDTHQRFEPDAIAQLVASLQDPAVGASSGSLVLPRAGATPSLVDRYWTMERWLRRCEAHIHSSVGVTGAIWALRKSLWTPLPPALILDDVYTPMRVVLSGYRVSFVESARALETRRVAMGQEYRRKVRTLTGVTQLLVMLPSVLFPNRNPIWAQFIVHKLLRLLTPYWVLGVALWCGSFVAPWLLAHPELALAGALPLAIGSLHATGRRMIRRAGSGAVSVLLLQAAVVVATVNGLRRRWDVWADGALGIADRELRS
jgi:cellulose synthase/poly-beta-1,6-N-acetylglucosamine synthase-like glycosyltransferase